MTDYEMSVISKVLNGLRHHAYGKECKGCPYGSSDGYCEREMCDNAADVIEFLMKMQKPQWISVYDCLPEQDGTYLVYDISGDIYKAQYDSEQNEDEHFGEMCTTYYEGTLIEKDSYWIPNYSITHWQPLTEPPQEGTADDEVD